MQQQQQQSPQTAQRKRKHEHIARRAAPAASCFFESVPLGAGLQQKTCSAAAQQLEFPAWKTARRAAIFAGSKAVAAVVPIKTQPCDGLKPEQKKAEIRAPGADFAKKRQVAGFLSYLARSAPSTHLHHHLHTTYTSKYQHQGPRGLSRTRPPLVARLPSPPPLLQRPDSLPQDCFRLRNRHLSFATERIPQ